MIKKILLSISFLILLISCSTDPKTIIGTYDSRDGRLKMNISDNGEVSFSSTYTTAEGSLENIFISMSNTRLSPWNVSDVFYNDNYSATGIYGSTNIYLDFDFDNKTSVIECELEIKGGLPQYYDTTIVFNKNK